MSTLFITPMMDRTYLRNTLYMKAYVATEVIKRIVNILLYSSFVLTKLNLI